MAAESDNSDRRRWQFGLKGLLLLFFLLSVPFSLAYYWRRHVVAQEQEAHLADFKQVVLMLHNYNDAYGRLPPPVFTDVKSGKTLFSWRFPMLNFGENGFRRIDESAAWDSPANRPFWDWNYFFDLRWRPDTRKRTPNRATNIFAITGPGTAFDDAQLLSRLSDAESDAILIVEVRDSRTHWMQPGDFDIRTMPRTINAPDGRGISGVRPDGFGVGFADGAAWFLSNRTPFAELRKFFTIESARRHDREQVLGEYRLR